MGTDTPKHGRPRDKGWYLKYAKAGSFGGMSQTTLGPFGPGLNIVHGENEAGKTTFANLIGGVMFGWEDGRSSRNTYKPANAERSGALVFAREDDGGQKIAQLSRVRNADGLQGDRWLLGDIDKETYAEIFSLNSDQLRSMGDASQVTSRLLTASAGTATPPAQVREELDARIAEYTSRSTKYPHSITRLTAERDHLAARIATAQEEAARLAKDEAELMDLRDERGRLQAGMRGANARVERMTSCLTTVETLDERMRELENELEALDVAPGGDAAGEGADDLPARLMAASDVELEALCERVDALEQEEQRAKAALDQARQDYEETFRDYEAKFAAMRAAESGDAPISANKKGTFTQIGIFAIAAIAFAALGVCMAIAGGDDAALPMVGLFGIALVFAIIAVVSAVWGLATSRHAGGRSDLEEAEWLMNKERSRYEKAQAAWDEKEASIRMQLDAMGCGRAEGSLLVARALLDKAAAAHQQADDAKRAQETLEARRAALRQEIESCRRVRGEQMQKCGLNSESGTVDLDIALNAEVAKREKLARDSEELSRRAGQLEQRLDAARDQHDLDDLRMQHQQVLTRIQESQRALAELLLARRMLDTAIDEWKSSSQPEVHQAAERLFYRMTRGSWRHVEFDDEGKIVVSDGMGERRSPLLLSTGTAQQLYLALRIALLDTAEFVGRNVPVICDDILVNFDEKRRKAAAKALASLARNRQVIVFTCHNNVVLTLRTADPSANVIEL